MPALFVGNSRGMYSGSSELSNVKNEGFRPVFHVGFIPKRKRSIKRKCGETSWDVARMPALFVGNSRGIRSGSPERRSSNNDDDLFIRCYICHVSFRFERHYTNHFKEKHGNGYPFRCRHCRKTFNHKKSLVDHTNKNHGQSDGYVTKKMLEPIPCNFCDVAIDGWMAFEKHALTAHKGVKMMACSRCPRKYYRRNLMLIHERQVHDENFQLKCRHCKNIFDQTDVLKNHEEHCELRQLKKFKGDNKKFSTKTREEIHFPCVGCAQHFASIKELKAHYQEVHKAIKVRHCVYCEASFSCKRTYDKHLDMKHAEKWDDQKETTYYRRGVRFPCEYCDKVFLGVSQYEQHGAECHPGQPMFYCPECDRGFVYKKNLRTHANEMHGNATKRCRFCTKCYFRSDNLQRHERSCEKRLEKEEKYAREGIPRLRCRVCDKYYYESSGHMRRHKHYDFCSICFDGFHRIRNPEGLAHHYVARHPLNSNIQALLSTVEDLKAVNMANIKEKEEMPD